MSSNEIGERIKRVRERERLNQREFGARLETSSGRISEIESGKTMPGVDFWLKLNEEFNEDITYIMTGKHQRQLAAEAVARVTAYATDEQRRLATAGGNKVLPASANPEAALIEHWKRCSTEDQAVVLHLVKRLAAQ